eukprot:TRINITY_DN7053_c0_g1_i3.p2 TRINITY_DN7053_c0_g1~~TRINITY_DN7053_c0_g1_i3.p2  ORF type:complete len:159 (+),score=44.78 TRINITY_DN7053_c0_g1_i3:64-540(+)
MAVADVIAPPPHLAAPAPCVAASDDAAMAASDAAEANSPEKKRKTDGAELEVSTAAAAAAAPSAAAQEVPQEASGAAVEAVRQPQESEVVEWSPAPGLEDFAGFRFTGSLRRQSSRLRHALSRRFAVRDEGEAKEHSSPRGRRARGDAACLPARSRSA